MHQEKQRLDTVACPKLKHLPRSVDIGVGRDQPVDYRSVSVLNRDVQRGDPILRREGQMKEIE